MATSGATTFSLSRDDVLIAAYRVMNVYDASVGLSTQQKTDATQALNIVLKEMQTDGMLLWKIVRQTVPLAAGQSMYTIAPSGADVLAPKPLRLVQAVRHDSTSDSDVAVMIWARSDYEMQTSKTSSGVPTAVYYEPQRLQGVCSVWPTPDATTAANVTLKLRFQYPVEDMVSATDEFDFPNEWYRAIKWGLAAELWIENAVPMSLGQLIEQKAERYRLAATTWSQEEASTSFGVDTQGWTR